MDGLTYLLIILTTIVIEGRCTPNSNCSSVGSCYCYEKKGYVHADCSHRELLVAPLFRQNVVSVDFRGNLFKTFPSNLTKNIRYLNLADNFIERIEDRSLFSNATLQNLINLENLTLSNNTLHVIEPGAFRYTPKLRHLDLSFNSELSLSILEDLTFDLNYTVIKVLNLEKVQCTYGISKELSINQVRYLSNTALEEFNIASNRISFFQFGMLSVLPKTLRKLNVADNMLGVGTYLWNLGQLSQLETLNASFQSRFHMDFNVQCHDNKRNEQVTSVSHLPQEKRAYFEVKYFDNRSDLLTSNNNHTQTFYLPPNLRKLYFHDNMYKFALKKLALKTAGKLTHVYFQNNIIYELIGPLFGMDSVQHADFSNNLCSFIAQDFFVDFANIKYLNLSNNILGLTLQNDIDGTIFKNQRKLEILDLSFNRIAELPGNIFNGVLGIRYLNLSSNSLSIFDITIHHWSKLHLLDLSSNKLSSLNKDTRSSLDRISAQKEIILNLQGNPLQCSCSNMDFLFWIVQSKKILFLNLDKYTCLFENATRREFGNFSKLMEQLEKECSSYTLIITISSSLLFIFVTIVISRIIHRYKWKLRYLYFVARGRGRNQKSSRYETKQSKYHFDAFISYANNDTAFVIGLVKYIEENYRLKLCLHQRDFIPGTDIADNITNAIHISKRTICILTSHYIKSYWCNYEMNMARMEAVYSRNGSNVLLFVILQKNVVQELPWKWMDLLESKSYLDFTAGDERDVSVFRTKFAETLLMEED